MDRPQEAPVMSVRKDVLEPAARLCAAARVLVRHGPTLNADESDKLLAEIDDAAGNLQAGVSTLVRSAADGVIDAARAQRDGAPRPPSAPGPDRRTRS